VRLFVALYPSPPALAHLAAAVDRLRLGAAAATGTNVRLVARPLWHLTVAFLGEVPDERAPHAQAALETAVTQWRALPAAAGGAPMLRLAGGGRFGRGRATVLWVGTTGDVDALAALARQVRRALRQARLPCDRKPFRPHLTLARPGDRLPTADLAADLAALTVYEGPSWPLAEVHLVRSWLGPAPVHERLSTVRLV